MHTWGGPTTVMESCFKKLALEYDHARLRCYTVSAGSAQRSAFGHKSQFTPTTR